MQTKLMNAIDTYAQALGRVVQAEESGDSDEKIASLHEEKRQARDAVQAMLVAAAPQAVHPENIREGAPYDNPEFEQLARDMGVWGTAQSAVCAQFWLAATQPAAQGLDTARLDYLQQTESTVDLLIGESMLFRVGGLHNAVSADLRTAIDAALAAQAKRAEAMEMARTGGCGCCANACADRADGCKFVHESPSDADMREKVNRYCGCRMCLATDKEHEPSCHRSAAQAKQGGV